MKRIFQHYEGIIKDLNGIEFSNVYSLINDANDGVILLWLKEKEIKKWYRIFIDGRYCGIDEYSKDGLNNDIDYEIKVINHSDWFRGKRIVEAKVTSNQNIKFVLKFEDGSIFSLNCLSEDAECNLKFID